MRMRKARAAFRLLRLGQRQRNRAYQYQRNRAYQRQRHRAYQRHRLRARRYHRGCIISIQPPCG